MILRFEASSGGAARTGATNSTVLTVEALKRFAPHSTFAAGYGFIEHPWFNDATVTLEPDGRSTQVRWVAVRGGIHDWAIYHSLDANFVAAPYLDDPCHLDVDDERIARGGAKLHSERLIRAWVPCTDEAFRWYRS